MTRTIRTGIFIIIMLLSAMAGFVTAINSDRFNYAIGFASPAQLARLVVYSGNDISFDEIRESIERSVWESHPEGFEYRWVCVRTTGWIFFDIDGRYELFKSGLCV